MSRKRRYYAVQLDRARGFDPDEQGISRWSWLVVERVDIAPAGESGDVEKIESWHDTRAEARARAEQLNARVLP